MIPWTRFFAGPLGREVAAAISRTSLNDWEVDSHIAYCAPLNITVWHANQGYGFEVHTGKVQPAVNGSNRIINGGADGELCWHYFKTTRKRALVKLFREHIARAPTSSQDQGEKK